MKSSEYDIAVVGGGAAGCTAALYAARAGKRTAVFLGGNGSQILEAHKIENYPGLSGISGAELCTRMEEQAKSAGAIMIYDTVTGVSGEDGNFLLQGQHAYTARRVILATGSRPRTLQIPGEERLRGRGVSYCALCDGRFFRGKEIAVVGGGNTALSEALYLSGICSRVYLIHRRDSFRAEESIVSEVKEKENITIVYNSVVSSVNGEDKTASISLQHRDTGTQEELPLSALFIATGREASPDVTGGAAKTENGFYITDEEMRCVDQNGVVIPGLFAAGDCRKKRVRQLTTAVADGTVAATMATEN